MQQNNNNIAMQSEDQQQHGGVAWRMNNNDVSHKNENDNTSATNQQQNNEQQPMESQQDDGLDANELTSTLMGDDNMKQEEQPPQGEEQEDSSSSESDGEEESSSSSSSSSSEEDESDNDEGLSEYELLRKRNIKRNQKRLRKLGLLTDNNTSALSAAAAKSNGGESNNNKPKKQVRKQQLKAPIQRRSLPRRKCAKLSLLLGANNENSTSNDMNNNNNDKTNGYESDESSIAPSPIKITRILHPQPHQKKSLEQQNETNLKQYKRTRRMKRGRPKREEYEYVCNESCKVCGGGWILDSNDENVEEDTRLIRCKDCRGAFHLKCMLAKGSDFGDEGGSEDEEEEDRKMPAISNDNTNASADDNDMSLEVVEQQETRDPKRCYKCEEEYKRRKEHEQQHTSSATRLSLPILEATLSNNQTVRVRVTPEPLLEANVNGKDVSVSVVLLNSGGTNGGSSNNVNNTKKKSSKEANGLTCPHCSKEFVSQGGLDYHIEKKVCQRRAQRKKHVTWGIPLEEKEEEGNDNDPTTKKIRKIINKALADTDYAKLQDYSCAALRKHIPKDSDKVVRLGGLQMLIAAMEHHPERPMIQAEALCTLSELAWALPQSSVDICRGCLDLVVAAMEHHSSHAKVLEMGCGLLRALSYDTECCVQLKKKKAVSVVVESIKHNPRKVNVMIEGSMFLQNMMVVSANTTLTSILGTTKRRRQMNDDDDQVDLLPTLLTAVQANSNNADLAFSVFGLLSNVAIHDKGSASLSSGLDVHTLATEVIRIHSSHSDLHNVVSSLLQNVEQQQATVG